MHATDRMVSSEMGRAHESRWRRVHTAPCMHSVRPIRNYTDESKRTVLPTYTKRCTMSTTDVYRCTRDSTYSPPVRLSSSSSIHPQSILFVGSGAPPLRSSRSASRASRPSTFTLRLCDAVGPCPAARLRLVPPVLPVPPAPPRMEVMLLASRGARPCPFVPWAPRVVASCDDESERPLGAGVAFGQRPPRCSPRPPPSLLICRSARSACAACGRWWRSDESRLLKDDGSPRPIVGVAEGSWPQLEWRVACCADVDDGVSPLPKLARDA